MNSYYCYIIKITKNNKLRGFKIGERGDTDRVENLIKKYEEDNLYNCDGFMPIGLLLYGRDRA